MIYQDEMYLLRKEFLYVLKLITMTKVARDRGVRGERRGREGEQRGTEEEEERGQYYLHNRQYLRSKGVYHCWKVQMRSHREVALYGSLSAPSVSF